MNVRNDFQSVMESAKDLNEGSRGTMLYLERGKH